MTYRLLEQPILRHLRLISYGMTVIGIALVAFSLVVDIPSMWTLAGMLLVVAGAVKIAVIALWRGVAAVDGPSTAREDV